MHTRDKEGFLKIPQYHPGKELNRLVHYLQTNFMLILALPSYECENCILFSFLSNIGT